ncbi:HlyD family efflux transporter periplasmic adaptor subunit [Brevibacillus ginsengisoli]|uniref:HlyD family efflux transporter periplasmic adaptor subunit n=1 Tax=Brevibacillus ginsengisoli TaxID=363854 RepID=UPI003CF13248
MKAKRMIIMIISIYLVVSAGISGYYWIHHQNYVETNDARAKIEFSVLKAPATGRVIQLDIRENQEVRANEVIGVIQAGPASPTPGVRMPLLAPVSGRVLRVGVQNQEVVSSGQNLVAIGDLTTTYVEARLTEDEVNRVRVGQVVDVQLDTNGKMKYKGIVSRIEGVTETAVWPLISLTPTRKQPREEQLVPVRILIPDVNIIPGTGAEIAIHVRGDQDGLF